ncbi:MAG: 4-hydroxy-3-methylbut-2-enyl diphosphate reductase [Desulfobacca sp.]|uniref:4-hydroxy-3-methylbut-2-enyl diphosphate reductase n=1 Tax=Desulfobacca sp. TaxID=2067990 RepID=UPI00404ADAED
MKVILARTAGFCMGVKRAMEMVLSALNQKPEKIYTYGPLIHNPQVLALLEERGIGILQQGTPEPGSLVVIRAHGIPPAEKKKLDTLGCQVIDATCPRVAKVQAIIRKWTRQGYATIIVGDADHPEVLGLMGYTDGKGYVVASPEDVARLPDLERVIVVAQTTQSEKVFNARVAEIRARFPEVQVSNTICDATARRQAEVQRLATEVEAIVVVGGRSSGNTQRLVEIARTTGLPTFHVETEQELDLPALRRYRVVGVTAGASTPHWLIANVVSLLKHDWAHRHGFLGQLWERFWRFLIKANIYVALGAGCLSYASSLLQNVEPLWRYFFVAFFYIYAMHILNNFTDAASKLNDPVQSRFYGRHPRFLLISAILSGLAALLLGVALGPLAFGFILIMTILGLLYTINIFPPRTAAALKIHRLKEIPGSKTVFTAVAWGVLAALIPVICSHHSLTPATAVAFLFVAGLVFIRCGLFEIQALEGDRIVGKETLAVTLGKEKTLTVLYLLTALLMGLLAVATFWGLLPTLGYALLGCGLYALGYLTLYRRGFLESGLLLEGLVESNMLLAGWLSFLWDPYHRIF